MVNKDNFLKTYDAVFNSDNTIKNCGREKCKDLIIACMILSKNNSNYFGNPDTGMMNVENIQTFKRGLSD